ncbi:hypothetical protein KL928_005343 [Ogataea angusta]|uniref:Uncharacterized protein n=1 Tax=Pichia angusta TaxID=870730 RepID=A0AAN6I3Q2_PICAN|nr:uncharacterized protein KL928_005343 [Ogataea angusta]KAG7815744.1 hypothetical protein KL928_005343 [Ogataea angusta]
MLLLRSCRPILLASPLSTALRGLSTSALRRQTFNLGQDPPRYKVPNEKEQRNPIKYRSRESLFFNKTLPTKFRLGNEPMYENPLAGFVAGAKRFSLAFGFVGLCFSYLMLQTEYVLPELCEAFGAASLLPYPVVQYLYSPYVLRIYRLYDTTKEQTLENLVADETLVFQKLNWSGFKVYNELVKVDDLQVAAKDTPEGRFGFSNMIAREKDDLTRSFYVVDGFGGMRMNRIWKIAETHSSIESARP